MDAMVYRKQTPGSWSGEPLDIANRVRLPEACDHETRPLSPALFYPLVTGEERVMWTHWLPTSIMFDRTRMLSPSGVVDALTRLKAPREVLEEFDWSWKMELFETYEVRTPERRDARDPLLLGRLGGQWYRLALWGESVRPLEEIAALVQQSLAIRARALKRRMWLGLGGTLPGLPLVVWFCALLWKGDPVGTGLSLTFLIFFAVWLPLLAYTPENAQQDFLDRYRR